MVVACGVSISPVKGIFGKRGTGELEFEFDAKDFYGGLLCFGELGRAFVAEFGNNRVQYVRVAWHQFVIHVSLSISLSLHLPLTLILVCFSPQVDVLDRAFVKMYGVGHLQGPRGVAYCPRFIAVSESRPGISRISMFALDGAYVGAVLYRASVSHLRLHKCTWQL